MKLGSFCIIWGGKAGETPTVRGIGFVLHIGGTAYRARTGIGFASHNERLERREIGFVLRKRWGCEAGRMLAVRQIGFVLRK